MMSIILDEIFANQDTKYRDFHSRLVPNVKNLIGLRAPVAKKIAKKYANTDTGMTFLRDLPHTYYEESLIHGYMLGFLKHGARDYLVQFLPHIDNWAVCDSMVSNLKLFFKDKENALDLVKGSLESKHTYTARFGLVALLSYYVTPQYIDFVLDVASKIKSDEYYINMANAWLVSVCLVKEYEKSIKILEQCVLDKWTHNKAIQKALESYRIDNKTKEYLRSLKIK